FTNGSISSAGSSRIWIVTGSGAGARPPRRPSPCCGYATTPPTAARSSCCNSPPLAELLAGWLRARTRTLAGGSGQRMELDPVQERVVTDGTGVSGSPAGGGGAGRAGRGAGG